MLTIEHQFKLFSSSSLISVTFASVRVFANLKQVKLLNGMLAHVPLIGRAFQMPLN